MDYSALDRDIVTVLSCINKLDGESAGAVRSRYKRTFDHIAAWLHAGMTCGFIGPDSAELTGASHETLAVLVAGAAFCSSIQCSSQYMFSS